MVDLGLVTGTNLIDEEKVTHCTTLEMNTHTHTFTHWCMSGMQSILALWRMQSWWIFQPAAGSSVWRWTGHSSGADIDQGSSLSPALPPYQCSIRSSSRIAPVLRTQISLTHVWHRMTYNPLTPRPDTPCSLWAFTSALYHTHWSELKVHSVAAR